MPAVRSANAPRSAPPQRARSGARARRIAVPAAATKTISVRPANGSLLTVLASLVAPRIPGPALAGPGVAPLHQMLLHESPRPNGGHGRRCSVLSGERESRALADGSLVRARVDDHH